MPLTKATCDTLGQLLGLYPRVGAVVTDVAVDVKVAKVVPDDDCVELSDDEVNVTLAELLDSVVMAPDVVMVDVPIELTDADVNVADDVLVDTPH